MKTKSAKHFNDVPTSEENEETERPKNNPKDNDTIYIKLLSDMNQLHVNHSNIIGLRPLKTFSNNFDNFNYGRGFHYFFDLKTFPRAQNSPSYAIDTNNRFNYTYRYDNTVVNGTKLNKLFNRKYVSIPSIQTTYGDKLSKDKNVCHYHLFNIEDKKYHNYRLIAKYKYVLKNLEKLHNADRLKFFTQIKKDVVTHPVCEKNVPIQRKKTILLSRIKLLEKRVENMERFWDWDDNNYYYFSLDQLFHDEAMSKGQKLTQKYLEVYILQKISQRKKYIEDVKFGSFPHSHEKMRNSIQKWMIFEEEQNNALSTLMRNRLMALPKIVEMFRTNTQLVIFPLFTFNFGSKEIQRFIDPLIKSKVEKEHPDCFYVYMAFVKRLLKRDLACQEEEVVEPMNVEQYTKQMRGKIIAISQFYEKEIVSHKKVLYADSIVQLQKLSNPPLSQKVHLLQPGHKFNITLMELMLLFYYRNISIALEQFVEYLKHDPQILKYMADESYHMFHYGIAKILHQPEFCILINDVRRFIKILSSENTWPEVDKNLCFSFHEKLRIAYAWHEPISQEWGTPDTEQEKDSEYLPKKN